MFNFEGIRSLFVWLKFGQFSWNTNAFSDLMHNFTGYCHIRREKKVHSVTNKFDFTLNFCLQLKILILLKKKKGHNAPHVHRKVNETWSVFSRILLNSPQCIWACANTVGVYDFLSGVTMHYDCSDWRNRIKFRLKYLFVESNKVTILCYSLFLFFFTLQLYIVYCFLVVPQIFLIRLMNGLPKYSSTLQWKQTKLEMCFHSGELVLVLSFWAFVVQVVKILFQMSMVRTTVLTSTSVWVSEFIRSS